MEYIKARLAEPSTHAGLCGLTLVLATAFPQYAMLINGLAAVFGFSSAALPDVSNK